MNRGGVLRMGIMHDLQVVPTYLVHGYEVANCLIEGAQRLVMIQIADMLADKRLPSHHQRNRVLQVRPDGEQRTLNGKSSHSAGRVAPRTTQYGRPKCTDPSYRIINSPRNWALADQERIRNAGQAVASIVILVSDRLAAA